jgi:predicted  nucleic acid-binding Zn-ribbon protein
MGNHSAEEVLHFFAEYASYITEITAEDLGISVIKDGIYVAYVPAKSLDLKIKPGEPMKGQVSEKCTRTGEKVIQVVARDQSMFGVPYLACAVPVTENGQTAGCIITTQTIVKQEKIGTIAGDLAAASEELTAGMEELTSRASELATASKQVDTISKGLAEATKQTDDIVAFIQNIANQTNLLGLNAAIEAARVGEMGRGFGVVAEEVRKLAVASSESVKNISRALQEIQTNINDLTDKITVIDGTVTAQASSVQEMAQSSQSLAAMAGELSQISQDMFQNTAIKK